MERIQRYLNSLQSAIESLSVQDVRSVIDLIMQAYEKDQQIFVIGNGGSASTASHFACDLGKGTIVPGQRRLRILSLTDNVAMMTAWANDASYDDMFVEQLKNLLNPGDLVIGISASGNSANVLKGVEHAREQGCPTAGLTGFGGGKLAQITDVNVVVDSDDYGPVEDIHMILDHVFRAWIHEELSSRSS